MDCCATTSNTIPTCESDITNPKKVAYFEHPKTNKRYNVLYTQEEWINIDEKQYLVCVYYMEDRNRIFYCEHYDGGNWIWESK
jgi:hypothetical protein